MSYHRGGRKRSFSPDRRLGRDRDRSRSRERDPYKGGGYGGGHGDYNNRYGHGGKGRREGKGYGKGYGKGKGKGGGYRGGGGGGGMRTHGSSSLDDRRNQESTEEEPSFNIIELLSQGLDFKLAMDESEEDDGENPMLMRVPALAAALCEKINESSEEETSALHVGVLKCISSLPVHTFLLGSMVAIMSVEESARPFTQGVINAAARGVVESMNKGDPRSAKCLLSFLAAVCASGGLDVSNEAVGFGPAVLQPLVDRVSGGSTQLECDQFASLFLCVIPVCGKVLSEGSWDINTALDVIEKHMTERCIHFGLSSTKVGLSPIISRVDDLEGEEGGALYKVSDSLQSYWEVVLSMRGDFSTDRPQLKCWIWSHLTEELADIVPTQIVLASNDETTTPLTHVWHSPQPSLVYPAAMLFGARCGEFGQALASLPSFTKLILTDLVMDVLFAFKPIMEWNGRIQGTLATAASQLLSVEYLVDGIRGDFLVVEAVITLAIVPASYLNVTDGDNGADLISGGDSCFFGHLLLELCKNNVKCCEPIAIGFDVVWQALDQLDHVTALRTAELLAHHLNNTKFRWPFWQRWMDSIDLEDERSVELRFLKHVLGVASNLNHSSSRFLLLLKDIEAELPSQLLTYLPPPLSAQFSSSTTFNTSEYHSIYREIKDLIESQLGDATKRFLLNAEGLVGPPSGISTQLTELIKLKGEACESLPKHWALNALMYGILTVGSCEIKYFSQTISNTLSLVDINEHVLKWLISPPSSLEEPQPDETLMNTYNVVLDSVASVWGGSPFVFEVVTTSLMRRGLIPPDKVIKWISSSKTPVLVDFNHMSIILIATAINHVPSLFDRGLSSGAAEYLGDCVVAALDPLLVQASEKQRLVDASEEDDEDDDAALDLKELVDKVRCVVRQGISVRSPTSQRLLNIDTSASVVTRVVKDDTPQAVKDVLSTLNISLY